MTIPDYGKCVEAVAGWAAAEAGLKVGATLQVEPVLPERPDAVATLFETGGTWDEERGKQTWRLTLAVRAPLLSEARALARKCLKGAIAGFMTATPAARLEIIAVRLAQLPRLQPRDERGRVILEAALDMTIDAPFEHGRDL